MKAKIRVLNPVHIGSGQSISPTGYFIDKDKGHFNFLKMETLFQDPDFSPYQEEFIREAGLSRYIGNIVRDHNLLKRHVLYSIPASPQARSSNPTEVKEFIKSAGRPYIPGSSLKGSIISALFYYALKELWKKPQEKIYIDNYLTTKTSPKNLAKNYNNLLEKVYSFLSAQDKSNFQRTYRQEPSSRSIPSNLGKFANLLDISDSTYLDAESSLKLEYSQVIGGKGKRSIPILYETLKPNVGLEVNIVRKACFLEEKEILEICHDFYLKVAHHDSPAMVQNLGKHHYVLRLGQGSSAFSTSFLILAEELHLKGYLVKPPRTRKGLIDGVNQTSFGYIQLTFGDP